MSSFTNKHARRAFTLIELLVVLAILTILVALSAGAYMAFMTSQTERTTRKTMSTVARLIDGPWQGVVDKANKEPISGAAQLIAGGQPMDAPRQRVVHIKLRLKQEFPQSFSEIVAPAGLAALPVYKKYLNDLGIVSTGDLASGQKEQELESAVCLLMFLETGRHGRGLSQGELTPFVKTFTYNGKQVRALVDGWGNPLVFCRFPTKSEKLNPSGVPQKDLKDPGDPEGHLASSSWAKTSGDLMNPSGYDHFVAVLHDLPQRPDPSAPATSYFIKPLIVSCGPDGQLGLGLKDFATVSTAQASDNLYHIDAE